MQIVMLRGDLTPIRSKSQAKEVLAAYRKQGATLAFPTSEHTKAVFTPIEGSTEFVLQEPDARVDMPDELRLSFQIDEERAVDRLFTLRKSFNTYWNR